MHYKENMRYLRLTKARVKEIGTSTKNRRINHPNVEARVRSEIGKSTVSLVGSSQRHYLTALLWH